MIWLDTDEKHNPGGVHAAYRVLKTFLRWYEQEAEPEGWKNPIAKIKAPKLAEEQLEPVSLTTVDQMTKACSSIDLLDLRDKALLFFLLDTGARASEVSAVDLADIDQVTGGVLIRKGKGRKTLNCFYGEEGAACVPGIPQSAKR